MKSKASFLKITKLTKPLARKVCLIDQEKR